MQVSDDPRVGTELAGYRIESLLGLGGMSVVYLAEDLRLKRPRRAEAPGRRSRRGRRVPRPLPARVGAGRVDRPSEHRPDLRGRGDRRTSSSSPCATSRGATCKERLRHGRLDPADATGILAQVASALDSAHARGLVHRDVKPSNVLLDTGARPDGSDHVYLADFGLTRRVADEAGLGEDGHLLGTIDYVAPEQIVGARVDGRADVYSLGCLLYECLVGEPPFRRDSELAVVFAHLEAEPPAAERGASRGAGRARRRDREGAREGAGAALRDAAGSSRGPPWPSPSTRRAACSPTPPRAPPPAAAT